MKIKFESRLFWKLISSALLVGMFFTFNQCVIQQYDEPTTSETSDQSVNDGYHDSPVTNSGTLPPGGSGEFEENGATEVARLVSDIGMKDFEAIYMSFQVLTGVRASDSSSLRSTYTDLKTQLPYDSSIKSFNTAHQIAIIKLASEICNVAFSSSNFYNSFFTNFNISQTPANSLMSEAGKRIMIQDFIDRFWGRNVQPLSVEEKAFVEIEPLIDSLMEGLNVNSTTSTRTIAKGVCTTVLSSAPVTTL